MFQQGIFITDKFLLAVGYVIASRCSYEPRNKVIRPDVIDY